MTEEKDDYHAPPLIQTSGITTVSPGTTGQKPRTRGQVHGTPTGGGAKDAEAGSVSVELVVATPLLLLLILLITQFAVWWHANHIAQAAAAQALAAARAQHATAANGEDEAVVVMSQAGRGVLRQPRVVVTRTGTRVHVRIDAKAEPVVPGLSLPVHAVADGPVDRWTVPAEGR